MSICEKRIHKKNAVILWHYTTDNMFENGSIKLRGIEPEDIGFIMDMENDTSIWRVSDTHNLYTRFDVEQYVVTLDKDIYSAKQLRMIIEDQDLMINIGLIDLYEFDAHNKRAGIGIMLTKETRNKGIGGIALDMIIEYAFNFLGLHQLFCTINIDNTESRKLFESRDFILAGTKKDWKFINDKFVDELIFQLINQNQI